MRTAVTLAVAILAALTAATAQPWIGDYDAELRQGDHVDIDRMVERLTDLGANTYMWLMWHNPNDWDDLHAFLPKAQAAGITVWAYLVPPSETSELHPEIGFPYSEPFRLDYIRWAEEIAKLSLAHPNLVGYVIDDFWGNVRPRWFSPEYTKRMVDAGKAINPDIKFMPLMYPSRDQIGPRFARMFGETVDGVVAAYPRDPEQIENILPYLRDTFEDHPSCVVSYPGWTPSKVGDCGFVEQTARVTDAEGARIQFHAADDFAGPTAGYHFMQLKLGGEVVWEHDVAGAQAGEVALDISEYVTGMDEVRVAFGIADKKGVSQFGVTSSFANLIVEGLDLKGFTDPDAWGQETKGGFTIAFHEGHEGAPRFSLPLILMPSGQRGEYEHRWGKKATAELIAKKVRMCLDLIREGTAQGMVTYCLNKQEGSEDFAAVKAEFEAYREAGPTGD